MSTEDVDRDEIAKDVIERLDPGTTIGDKVILSRRQLLAIAGGSLSIGALATFGVSESEAQSAVGQVGTSSDRVDVYSATVDSTAVSTTTLNGGGPISDGDGTERQIWIIANGASDPAGADPEDLIYEEEA
jgi:hypothetical protein